MMAGLVGGHDVLKSSGPPRRRMVAVKWCLVSVAVIFAVAILIAVPVSMSYRNRNRNKGDQNGVSAQMTAGQVVESLCEGADDADLCKQTLVDDNDGYTLNGSMIVDIKTLAGLPLKLLDASSSQLADINATIEHLVKSAENTTWEKAARACNASLNDALPLLVEIADATQQEEYEVAKAGLAALRTKTAECAEELFTALDLNYNVSSSPGSLNATFSSGIYLFNGTAGAVLYNSTVTLAFHLSNAMNVITKIKEMISGGDLLAAHNRKLYRRRLLAEADVDRSVEPDFIVDQKEGGNFKKIQQAINAALKLRLEGKDDKKRIVIKVMAGVYREKVLVPRQLWRLTVIGEGPTRTRVVWGDFTNPKNTTGIRTRDTYTFAIEALGFLGIDMAFQNDAGWNLTAQQAVAVRASLQTVKEAPGKLKSGLAAFTNCHFYGHQDTLYAHSGWQYYHRCVINGTVDYIFGNAAAVFQSCTLNSIRTNGTNTITAQARTSKKEETGFVFRFCDVDRTSVNQTIYLGQNHPYRFVFLGRPWRPYSRVVYMFCHLGGISPEGWMVWTKVGVGSDNHETAEYYEYKNTGPGSATESRVKWSRILTDEEAEDFTVPNFIHGRKWLPGLGVDEKMWS